MWTNLCTFNAFILKLSFINYLILLGDYNLIDDILIIILSLLHYIKKIKHI